MKKTTKGALAAAAAGSILLGGAGTLAYWTDTSTSPGGTITGGTLSLVNPTCTWTLEHTGATTQTAITQAGIANVRLVPGDKATQTCTSQITATGDNLAATLSVTNPFNDSGDLAPAISLTSSFKVGTQAVTRITSADNAKNLQTVVVVDFPFGTEDNSTNGAKTEVIPDFVVTATQVNDVTVTP
ncbi:alternate-type signal peptide domain-containing protein [Nocardioides sp. cx-173]|uniref:alternate-type signal peptide domain-containing protein n=1 Tax=Nocardioides sp. cx-173 TaxID=2898796 RepID=UPI001E3C353D|nr:alternate-type signal peptide domain-containing protein [Nocardioides sp. cx-173]MCD4525152.1 alternate-type signal peptide domain-containing protein [Nocardioides sp. cx-173]UGB40147.1 alternate-type signal peptide domain-containing protein [Nocardioides sp. cx-173]